MTSVFFSYSHADETLRDRLEKGLAMLKRQGAIDTWHDRRIPAGDVLDSSIDAAMEAADVVLLLVSPDFLASSYLSIGFQKGPPIGVQKGPPLSSSVTGMSGAPFALVAA